MDNVVRELECPICLQYMTGAITMCQTGHSICKTCRDEFKDSKCPLCGKGFACERNLALEKISSLIRYPCRNCTKLFEFKDIENHEKSCEFGMYKCPLYFLDCGWQKKLIQMKLHVERFHKKYINNWMNFRDINFYLTFFNSETFMVFGCNESDLRHYAAMYIGPLKNAKNYILKMNFLDQTTKGYSLTVNVPVIPQCKIEDVFKYEKITLCRDLLQCFAKSKTGKFVSEICIILKDMK